MMPPLSKMIFIAGYIFAIIAAIASIKCAPSPAAVGYAFMSLAVFVFSTVAAAITFGEEKSK